MDELKNIVAKNIIELRTLSKLTQFELYYTQSIYWRVIWETTY